MKNEMYKMKENVEKHKSVYRKETVILKVKSYTWTFRHHSVIHSCYNPFR